MAGMSERSRPLALAQHNQANGERCSCTHVFAAGSKLKGICSMVLAMYMYIASKQDNGVAVNSRFMKNVI